VAAGLGSARVIEFGCARVSTALDHFNQRPAGGHTGVFYFRHVTGPPERREPLHCGRSRSVIKFAAEVLREFLDPL
jgi:hypothetical protein